MDGGGAVLTPPSTPRPRQHPAAQPNEPRLPPPAFSADACVKSDRLDLALASFDALFPPGVHPPDARTFATLARGCAGADPPRWAELGRLMDSMARDHGLRPTTAVYNAALAGAARTRDVERAGAIIQQMQAAGVQPDVGTLEAVRQRRAMRSLLKKAFGR